MTARQTGNPAPLHLLRVFIISIVSLAGAGCGIFDPGHDKGDPPIPFQYPPTDTPQHTLLNLKYAWERRDSVRTREIYDDLYVGRSTDQAAGEPTLTFSKDQEVGVVWNMGKRGEITHVSFDMKPESTWTRLRYESDPQGYAAIQLPPGVSVQVDDIVFGTQIANSSNFFEFKFKPYVGAVPTDTTWKIVAWTETR